MVREGAKEIKRRKVGQERKKGRKLEMQKGGKNRRGKYKKGKESKMEMG